MKKIILSILIFTNIVLSNENTNKASELELFLFKIGFQSLLTDVDLTKEKANLNESQIKELNFKMDLIIKELRNKNLSNSKELGNNTLYLPSNQNNEIQALKEEIKSLKKELDLKNTKKQPKKNLDDKKVYKKAFVDSKKLYVRENPSIESDIVAVLKRNDTIQVWCNKYNWCELKDIKGFVKGYLISFY